MERFQLTEKTPLMAINDLRGTLALYNVSSYKHHNSVHCAVAFHRGEDHRNIENTLTKLVAVLAKHVGCSQHGITIVGVVIEQDVPVIPGMVDTTTSSHAHLIIRSVRSRKTGKTVSRIKEHHPAIETAMAGTAFRSMVLEPIYSLPGLIDYINGHNNILALGARVFTIKPKEEL